MIAGNASVIPSIFDWYAIPQHAMKSAVVANERGCIIPQQFAQRFLARVARNRGIQSCDRIAQSSDEHDIGKRFAFGRDFAGREMRGGRNGIMEILEPAERSFFDYLFV